MRRVIAWLILAIFVPLAIGQSVPKPPWEHTLARDWRDGAIACAVAGLVIWARSQLEPAGLDGTEIEP